VSNRGRDPFGDVVRAVLPPTDAVAMLADVGAWGVNLHDNDLVPIDASPAEHDRIVKDFKRACEHHGLVVPMTTVNLFYDPVFRDGAFTANDARVRAYAVQKTLRAMDLGAELGAKIFVLWGGREGTETDACRRPDEAIKRLREAVNYLCAYSLDRGYGFRFALEAKPNEPRGDIYMATTGAYLGFIPTLDHPEMVGVNPEVAHEQMAGLNFLHAVAQAWEAGKLFHIDLNDQMPGRYDQDFRFGSANVKSAFWLVKFLEDVGYDGPRHFDAHAYRTEDACGVREFARGCMRTYLILREHARRWNADKEIQAMVAELGDGHGAPTLSTYSPHHRESLLGQTFDRAALAQKGLAYERLDQLTMELLLGVR
jgi:xylose isomerase